MSTPRTPRRAPPKPPVLPEKPTLEKAKDLAVTATKGLTSGLTWLGMSCKALGGIAQALGQVPASRLVSGVSDDLLSAAHSLEAARRLISGEVTMADYTPVEVVEVSDEPTSPGRRPRATTGTGR